MSNKPVLYSVARSPPCRAVMMTAAAIGLELDVRDPRKGVENYSKINPVRTVPTLNDNEIIVNDSHVINAYFIDKYSTDDMLYPKNPEVRKKIDWLLYFDACHLFGRFRRLVEEIFNYGNVELEDINIKMVQKSYDLLENVFSDSPYLCGEFLTIADLHAMTSITSAMLFIPLNDEKHPKIKAWINRLTQLPYYEINQNGLDELDLDVRRKIEENIKAKKE